MQVPSPTVDLQTADLQTMDLQNLCFAKVLELTPDAANITASGVSDEEGLSSVDRTVKK
jgi:hypothetical protein